MNALPNAVTAAALLVLASSVACSSWRAPGRALTCPADSDGVPRPEGPGWHHGPIVAVDSARANPGASGRMRQLLVQVEPAGASTGRIWFGVNESTHLACRSGARLSPSAPLTPGMTVSAWSRMIMESDPGQAFADTLIVGSPRR